MKIVFHTKLPEAYLTVLVMCSFLVGFYIGLSLRRAKKVDVLNVVPSSECQNYSTCLPEDFITDKNISNIFVATNPRGAERLPPGIVEPYSSLNLNGEDMSPKYLLTVTVGVKQKDLVNKIISKFTEDFAIVLFHYDERANEWDEYEWSKRAIHVTARKQTKWWYAKRFLHPDIVAQYEYIFIWDEDLGVENFNANEYIKLVKKYGLEISQPAIVSQKGLTWLMTMKRPGVEVHRKVNQTLQSGQCADLDMPPCAGFVEIMAPVFSRESWRCVWNLIQNDLVHGWGLDFALWRCVKRAHEKMGVVDAQWIEHLVVPSLGSQGESIDGKEPWEGVRARCIKEWKEFEIRMEQAVKNQSQWSLP
ncbi:hypothetical protein DM860_014386 [Cuscuta australis]|uniref:Uncharacterized protein n=1 Tax=Cuscuta australis TaxID=267555 RepID=A0A328DDP7_9ASTE|nr:hypothetical protein DM860_014386 [Cuscuta australis]